MPMSVRLDAKTERLVERLAKQTGQTKSEVIREAIGNFVHQKKGQTDTAGPLVALIHADDAHHDRCKDVLQSLREPLFTVWPALTEAMYVLNFSWRAQEACGR